ncbi:flavodoxin family protein [Halanaerobium kushneri]|uniref:Multimeric flavodoxin WrbA n=1 Tax=Halanaerobium kushneri TaxID=56779 RepID=A0A1N6YRY2_9FIRM|nr:flavodoxin family protein [Halanaerobium kushneri]SIR17327.1 Multimeric flavodoxin WrbA [Halanaerobium kushneri]
MKAIIISGSPRKKGNTEAVLSLFENKLKNHGISTKMISLSDKDINHCLHCDKCIGINSCTQNDDFNNIYKLVLQNKGLIIGSPVYVGAPTSLILALLQRMTYVSFNNNQTLSKKIGGPIAIAGETGHLTAINCLVDFYLVNEMIIPSSNYWNIGTVVNARDVLKEENGLSYLKRFAKNFAWLIRKIEE